MQIFFLLTLLLVFSSCAKLQYLEQGLTLKGYSEEKDAQAGQVEAADVKFEALLDKVRAGEDLVRTYPEARAFVAVFGAPVLRERAADKASGTERWLYRYQVRYFDSPKVYLYVDAKGLIIGSEFIDKK